MLGNSLFVRHDDVTAKAMNAGFKAVEMQLKTIVSILRFNLAKSTTKDRFVVEASSANPLTHPLMPWLYTVVVDPVPAPGAEGLATD